MPWREDRSRRHRRAHVPCRTVTFSRAAPNLGHRALARLERGGVVSGVVTQNVDRLHHAAGSARVVELHGALAETRCTACGAREPRESVQARLASDNPGFLETATRFLPDGDAELRDEVTATFSPPACLSCGGDLRPDVVLFGESVPRPVVDAAYAIVDAAPALLVVGTSLTVFSGYRFVRRSVEQNKPIAIVNLGPCRGEEHAEVRVDAKSGEVLGALEEALLGRA